MLDVFQKLSDTSSKTEKAKILSGLNETQKKLFVAALDPMRIYFYQMPLDNIPPSTSSDMADEAASKMFLDLLDALSARLATGTSAHEVVRTTFMKFSKNQQQWFARILNKDLKVGVEVKSYLAVHKGAFEVFETQLCEKWEPGHADISGWYAEIKYDGLRAVACVTATAVEFFSRNGKPIYGNEHMHDTLKEMYHTFNPGHMGAIWLDGELKGGGFNDSVSVMRSSKNKKDSSDVCFYVFDILVGGAWKKRDTPPLETRRKQLHQFFGVPNPDDLLGRAFSYKKTNILATGQVKVKNDAEVHHYFGNVLRNGHEGLILKKPGSKYEWKRSKNWLKVKAEETEDLEVVGYYEGEAGSKQQGMLGGLICDRKGIQVRVGGGFSQDQIKQLWDIKEKLLGKVIEVKFHEVTPDGSLRHPRFVRFREDKE